MWYMRNETLPDMLFWVETVTLLNIKQHHTTLSVHPSIIYMISWSQSWLPNLDEMSDTPWAGQQSITGYPIIDYFSITTHPIIFYSLHSCGFIV